MARFLAIALLVFFTVSSSAHAQQLHADLMVSEDPRQVSIAVSPCTGEEAAECVDHVLVCDGAQSGNMRFIAVTGEIDALATKLIVGTQGQVNGELKLTTGKVAATMPISTIELSTNELNGGWSMTVSFADYTGMLEAITDQTAQGASIVLGGQEFVLTPEKGDGAKLLSFKESCVKYAN